MDKVQCPRIFLNQRLMGQWSQQFSGFQTSATVSCLSCLASSYDTFWIQYPLLLVFDPLEWKYGIWPPKQKNWLPQLSKPSSFEAWPFVIKIWNLITKTKKWPPWPCKPPSLGTWPFLTKLLIWPLYLGSWPFVLEIWNPTPSHGAWFFFDDLMESDPPVMGHDSSLFEIWPPFLDAWPFLIKLVFHRLKTVTYTNIKGFGLLPCLQTAIAICLIGVRIKFL